jgi:hypothetical protein
MPPLNDTLQIPETDDSEIWESAVHPALSAEFPFLTNHPNQRRFTMAKSAKNLVLHGASGKLGDQIVIRQRGGETILSQAPGQREGESTPAQKTQQQKFEQAILYGKAQIADSTAKAEYGAKALGMKSAFNVAVADFLHAPHIDEIDLTAYQGAVNNTIRVRVTDDFKVQQVQVSILNSDGTLVEQGDAAQQTNQIDWVYTATAANESTAGDKIVVRASDKPGHISTLEQVM